MSNFKRKKQKQPKGDTWSHRPEPDPEPDPSKNGPVKKKKKKLWVITGLSTRFGRAIYVGPDRVVYARYATEQQAKQGLVAYQRNDDLRRSVLRKWPNYEYRIEYKGKDK